MELIQKKYFLSFLIEKNKTASSIVPCSREEKGPSWLQELQMTFSQPSTVQCGLGATQTLVMSGRGKGYVLGFKESSP